jgi:hypothetical protein
MSKKAVGGGCVAPTARHRRQDTSKRWIDDEFRDTTFADEKLGRPLLERTLIVMLMTVPTPSRLKLNKCAANSYIA